MARLGNPQPRDDLRKACAGFTQAEQNPSGQEKPTRQDLEPMQIAPVQAAGIKAN